MSPIPLHIFFNYENFNFANISLFSPLGSTNDMEANFRLARVNENGKKLQRTYILYI